MNGQKNSRLPDSLWHTVNRLTGKMGTGFLDPCPTHASDVDCNQRAGASEAINFAPQLTEVKR